MKDVEAGLARFGSIVKPDTGELKARATFQDQMAQAFSLDDLREICFELDVNFDSVPGETIDRKTLELYSHMERRGDVYRLAAVCEKLRPKMNWVIT